MSPGQPGTAAAPAARQAGPDGPGPGDTRLRIDISYDGTGFHGWSRQPGLAAPAVKARAVVADVNPEPGVSRARAVRAGLPGRGGGRRPRLPGAHRVPRRLWRVLGVFWFLRLAAGPVRGVTDGLVLRLADLCAGRLAGVVGVGACLRRSPGLVTCGRARLGSFRLCLGRLVLSLRRRPCGPCGVSGGLCGLLRC